MHPKVLSTNSWKTVRKLVAGGHVGGWMLAGGTALALELGHRLSEDLDFFSAGEFDAGRKADQLSAAGAVRIQSRTDDTLHILLDHLRLSFLKAQPPLLFSGTVYRGLTIADPRDIAVMKVIAIGGRGSRRDFVDLYFLLQSGCDLAGILELVRQRFTRIDYNSYHLLKSLVYFDDAEREPMPEMIRPAPWERVKKTIIEHVTYYQPGRADQK
jgi:hypothetical protein